MATPVLLYGRESWVTKQQGKNRIQVAEMKFLWKVKGFSQTNCEMKISEWICKYSP
jgi:hypothetical protein